MKSEVRTNNAPQPIGPYSQAISAEGKFLFISEQVPLKADGTSAGNDIESQTHQVIKNLIAILEEAGLSIDNVVKTSVFMKDLNDFGKMNEIYNSYFGTSRPARTAFEVCRIPKDSLIGLEAIAVY